MQNVGLIIASLPSASSSSSTTTTTTTTSASASASSPGRCREGADAEGKLLARSLRTGGQGDCHPDAPHAEVEDGAGGEGRCEGHAHRVD